MRALLIASSVLATLLGLAWLVFVTNPPPELAVANGPTGPARLRPQGGSYTLAAPEPGSLNPFTADSPVARRLVLRYVVDTLFDQDPRDAALRPAIAVSVETEPDRRTHRFRLREGAVFADGTPVTIADLLFPFEVARDPAVLLGGGAQFLRDVELAEAVDARHLRVRIARDDFGALPELATRWFVVSRQWFLAQVAERARAEGIPPPAGPGAPQFARLLAQIERPGPCSGPYRVGEWLPANELTLVRNESSWRRAAQPECWNLDLLRLRFLTDPSAQRAALREGRLDLWIQPDAAAVLEGEPELAERYRPLHFDHAGLGHYMVVWNLRRPPLADPRVRRALGALFDRDAIAALFSGSAVPAYGWFKPGTPAYPEPRPQRTLERARELLAEAGVTLPLQVDLTLVAGIPEHRKILALAADRARGIGLELRERAVDSSEFERSVQERDFDGVLAVWSQRPWIDPYDEFHSRGVNNWSGLADPEVDRLLEAARATADDGERVRLYHAFQERLARLEPVTLLVHPRVSCLFARRFADAEPGALGLTPERWYVAK